MYRVCQNDEATQDNLFTIIQVQVRHWRITENVRQMMCNYVTKFPPLSKFFVTFHETFSLDAPHSTWISVDTP